MSCVGIWAVQDFRLQGSLACIHATANMLMNAEQSKPCTQCHMRGEPATAGRSPRIEVFSAYRERGKLKEMPVQRSSLSRIRVC